MKKAFELPELKLESLQACEAIMDVEAGDFVLERFTGISLTEL